MNTALALWMVGAVIALLVALLVIVLVARRLDRAGGAKAPPKPAEAEPDDDATTITTLLSKAATGKTVEAKELAGLAVSGAAKAGSAIGFAIPIGIVFSIIASIVGAIWAVRDDHRPPEGATPIHVEMAAGDLHGTLLSPNDDAEVVLIVPGSGPTDRDGNNPAGLKTDAYRKLAEGLWSEGFATVRVDKRGMFGSAAAGDPNAVSIDAYAADYRAWIDAVRERTGAECVWLLGHSEGALMVSAAAEGRKDVCGLILVAGMGRKMGEVIRQQLRDNPANAPVLDQALSALSELEAGRHVDVAGMHPALLPLFAPAVQDYLISILPVDPAEVLRRANKRTLIVQGRNDLQVTAEDAKRLDKAPKTRLRFIDGMNHVLKEAPIDRAANIATYSDPALPLAPRLVGRIEDFIEDND